MGEMLTTHPLNTLSNTLSLIETHVGPTKENMGPTCISINHRERVREYVACSPLTNEYLHAEFSSI